jgi:hypothetical protein
MTPESGGGRGGFGGEELTIGEAREGGGAGTVAGGTKGLDWENGLFAAVRAGEAVCEGGFATFGPGERCSAGFSAGRLAGIVEGTAAGEVTSESSYEVRAMRRGSTFRFR